MRCCGQNAREPQLEGFPQYEGEEVGFGLDALDVSLRELVIFQLAIFERSR
jgi:hypothetical protein